MTASARLADTDRFQALDRAGVQLAVVVAADLTDEPAFLGWVRSQLVIRAVSLGLTPPRHLLASGVPDG
ncbi:MAG: hypothetical protein ACR2MA_01675 [Egibacteraceae bacterium]